MIVQEIPAFRDFTIRDPRHFVILFEAKFHDFEEKIQKKFFFSENYFFFLNFFFGIFFWIFFFFSEFFFGFFFVFNSYL